MNHTETGFPGEDKLKDLRGYQLCFQLLVDRPKAEYVLLLSAFDEGAKVERYFTNKQGRALKRASQNRVGGPLALGIGDRPGTYVCATVRGDLR